MRLFLALAAVLIMVSCGITPTATAPTPIPVYGTLVGYDEVTTGRHIDEVELFDVPPGTFPAHTVVTLRENDRVQILNHDTNGAYVRTDRGAEGWVPVDAIKELR